MDSAVITILIIAVMFIFLIFELLEPILCFFLANIALLLFGIINVDDIVSGFSNVGVLTVGVLLIITASVKKSPLIFQISNRVSGREFKGRRSLLKILLPVTLLSSFMNNTPVVALFTPMVRDWCKKVKINPSKILIPISYVSIFGGILTLIGTSTNLIINGLLVEKGLQPLGMFQLTKVSIFLCIAGYIYIFIFYNKNLPDNVDAINAVKSNTKDYLVSFQVSDNCSIIDKTVEEAGLRDLEGLYLIEIRRDDRVVAPVARFERIVQGDELVFTGKVDTLTQLQTIKGLNFQEGLDFSFEDLKNHRAEIVEAVVSESFPYLNRSIKSSKFRNKYGAAVIAVIRNGERLKEKIGNIKLKSGDTLLLIAKKGFIDNWGSSNDFYLISNHEIDHYLEDKKSLIPIISFILVILLATFNIVSIFEASLIGLSFLFITRTLYPKECIKMVSWETLGIIALSFGIGRAMIASGAANMIADKVLTVANGFGDYGALLLVYILANVFTELITNNAAAVLSFPIAYGVSESLGVSYMPFIIAVAIAASASFSSPYGYQTNLMVYALGGYKFKDFIKFGLPLNIIFMIISVIVIPIFFTF